MRLYFRFRYGLAAAFIVAQVMLLLLQGFPLPVLLLGAGVVAFQAVELAFCWITARRPDVPLRCYLGFHPAPTVTRTTFILCGEQSSACPGCGRVKVQTLYCGEPL
jgi:hypothetical protein